MTTINTFEDILEAMERNPAFRDAMRRHVLAEGQAELSASVARLTEGQAKLAEGQAELSASVARLTEGQAKLAEGQAELHASVARLMEEQVRLTRGQGRMSGQLSNLTGSNYERRASRVVLRRLKWLFDIDPSEIIRSDAVLDKPDIINRLNRAVNAGIVSDDEADDVDLADIIIRGEGPDQTTVHVVVEVSITMHEEDIERASRRAAVLERATGEPTHAVVVAQSASPTNQELAEQEKVIFFLVSGWQE